MSVQSFRSFPHLTLWRRLRRRYYLDSTTLFAGLFVLPPAFCGVAWLFHGPLSHWLAVTFGVLWFLASTFMTLAMLLCLVVMRRQSNLPARRRAMLLWQVVASSTTLLALVMGRVDAAFYFSFGGMGLTGLWDERASVRNTIPPLIVAIAVCFAFAAHAVWLVIPLLLLHNLSPWRVRPSLQEEVRRRPTRTEYLAQSRERCATGGG